MNNNTKRRLNLARAAAVKEGSAFFTSQPRKSKHAKVAFSADEITARVGRGRNARRRSPRPGAVLRFRPERPQQYAEAA